MGRIAHAAIRLVWGERSMDESPWGEMSSAGRNVHGANCQWGEKSTNLSGHGAHSY